MRANKKRHTRKVTLASLARATMRRGNPAPKHLPIPFLQEFFELTLSASVSADFLQSNDIDSSTMTECINPLPVFLKTTDVPGSQAQRRENNLILCRVTARCTGGTTARSRPPSALATASERGFPLSDVLMHCGQDRCSIQMEGIVVRRTIPKYYGNL